MRTSLVSSLHPGSPHLSSPRLVVSCLTTHDPCAATPLLLSSCYLCTRRRYGGEHAAPELQKEAVYGLTEIYRDAIRSARLVANPGCYPTSVQLPLHPLLQQGLITPDDIIIDAKSGAGGHKHCDPEQPLGQLRCMAHMCLSR
jgi:hypothetical protein